MIEVAIKLAGIIEPTKKDPLPHVDATSVGYHKLRTPSYYTLDRAMAYGVDMTDPSHVTVPRFSIILAALLTESEGIDAAFRPVRSWTPVEVSMRMLPEEMDVYDRAIADVIDDLRAEITARKGESPNPSPAAASMVGGGKPSGSRKSPKSTKASASRKSS